jgi:hypothetical protein
MQTMNMLAREQRRGEALEAGWQPVLGRRREREAVCKSLEAGRLSLLEAAVRFREVHRGAFPGRPKGCVPYPGNSEGERLCREVIDYTGFVFAGQPDRCAALKGRLTAELNAELDHADTITSPDGSTVVSLARERRR